MYVWDSTELFLESLALVYFYSKNSAGTFSRVVELLGMESDGKQVDTEFLWFGNWVLIVETLRFNYI